MRRFIHSFVCASIAVAAAASTASASSASVLRHAFLSAADRGLAADVIRTHGDVRDLGRLGANKPVRIGLMMRYRNEAELEALTIAQGNRRSPYYHRYLTVAQWDNYFAPDVATYQRAISTLQRAGFRIEQTFRNRGMIRATAPARVAEGFFRTTFHQVVQNRRGQRYVNVTPAVLPSALKDSVVGVSGLHSIVNMHFPIHFASRDASVRRARIAERDQEMASLAARRPFPEAAVTPSPKPLTTSTPGANPSPDPTESSGNPLEEYGVDLYLGYGPPTFANAYDFPVQHGYGGSGHSAGSVIDSDFSDEDSSIEYKTFGIQRTGSTNRVCTDPNNACTICPDMAGVTAPSPDPDCDPEGESTLDAQTIMTLDPQVNFYEYLVNSQDSLDDLDVDGAYERVVSDDVVDAVNSSFGECETDDPSALFDENYIAMEGAAEGIMFSASAGDTGGTSCGLYAGNGAPQTLVNVSEPASAPYFTAVGGTSFEMLARCTGVGSNCYTEELGWINGGGGVSVLEPQPSWQTALVAAGTTVPVSASASLPAPSSGRDVPDLSFTADPEMGVPLAVTYQAETEGIGGTSLSSPMWVAMQTEINQVQGSRNGFVNPRLYAIADSGSSTATDGTYYKFAFRDIEANNNIPYEAGPGYDLVTGIGSVLGWELAGTE